MTDDVKTEQQTARLRGYIEDAINRCSAEGGSNTPDYILATYLMACLRAFDEAVNQRSSWYGNFNTPTTTTDNQQECECCDGVGNHGEYQGKTIQCNDCDGTGRIKI